MLIAYASCLVIPTFFVCLQSMDLASHSLSHSLVIVLVALAHLHLTSTSNDVLWLPYSMTFDKLFTPLKRF
jgi:hypothetical protein